MRLRTLAALGTASATIAGAAYAGIATGAVTLDIGAGRRRRDLGPLRLHIAAPPETIFDVIAAPYLQRTPRAMASKLQVLEHGADYALAAHFTPIRGGLTAKTVELVRFERPQRITFDLVRGPVSEVHEVFVLTPSGSGTDFEYAGHIAADLWAAGAWWASVVGARWEAAVASTLEAVRVEAERRAAFSHERR